MNHSLVKTGPLRASAIQRRNPQPVDMYSVLQNPVLTPIISKDRLSRSRPGMIGLVPVNNSDTEFNPEEDC